MRDRGMIREKSVALFMAGAVLAAGGFWLAGFHNREVRAEETTPSKTVDYANLLYTYDDPAYMEQKAIVMAASAIRDYYAGYEVQKKAIPAMEDILDMIEPVPSRTAIRFLLADLHLSVNQRDKAFEQYHAIIRESQADLSRRGF